MENNLHPRILQSLHLYVMYARLLQLYLTLCDPMDYRPPGSFVHTILQARILERVAITFSRDHPDPGIEFESLKSPAMAGEFFTTRNYLGSSYMSCRRVEFKKKLFSLPKS